MDDTTHELFLRLAGRVDDDLLADARELVAVGEDGHALELVTAALAADGTPLPPAVRAELVTAAAAARIDLDAEAGLAPAAPDTTAHRFSATAEADVPVVAAVRELPNRLRDGVRLRLAWRQTPAGPAPTPLPQPVLLVETAADGRPGEVLAYQVGAAMARSGVHVAVEVLTSGRPLTSYHAAALRDSTPLSSDAPPRAASPPEKVESVVAEVVQEVTASHRPAPPEVPPVSEVPPVDEERPGDLFAVDDEPAPRPVPMRAWQSGRRRRGFGEQVAEAEGDDDVPEATDRGPLPSPVPLARRTRPRPVEAVAEADPLLDPVPDEHDWSDEWASGDWAVGGAPTAAPDAVAGPDGSTARGTPATPAGPHSSTAGAPASPAGPHSSTAGAPATPAGPPNAAAGPSGPITGTPAPADRVSATSAGPYRPTAAANPQGAFSGAAQAATPADGSHALFTERADPRAASGPGQNGTSAAPATPGSREDAAHPAPERPTSGGPAHALVEPPTGPLPVVGQATGPLPVVSQPMAEALLKPEALARLSDADRELLTRLQAELTGGAPGPRGPNGNGPNGAAPA
jgi:hypothetical protein